MHINSALLTIWFLLGAGKPMVIEKGPLNLSGEDYWNEPLSRKGDIGVKRIMAEADGLLLDAPLVVDLAKHSAIPVICHRSGPTEKLFQFNLKTTTQFIVSHLESGAVQLTKLAPSPDRRRNSPPSPGWTTDWLEIDLDQKVDLGPKMGRYAIWTVCGPEASNIRVLDLRPVGLAANSQEYQKKILKLNENAVAERTHAQQIETNLLHLPLEISNGEENYWKLNSVLDSEGMHRLRLGFRIQGLPGFLFKEEKKLLGKDGRKIYGRIPILVFGFSSDRTLQIQSVLEIPIVEKPTGNETHPILSGNVTFRLPDFDQKDFFTSSMNIWVTALDQRGHVELAAIAR